MIRIKFNGKPFDSKKFQEHLKKQVANIAADHAHENLNSIRHPETGEFPTVMVSVNSVNDMKVRVEGSPELIEIVNQRLGVYQAEDGVEMESKKLAPKVFLSYTWDDGDLAKDIAHALMEKGIETWWDKWCIGAGDSFRQKIDEGLEDCTHFLVLLTPNSMSKPWVNQEMDAGLMRKLQDKSKFIPVRYQISAKQLPPLLSGMSSPEIVNLDESIKQLVSDIYGISKKPALGRPPTVVAASEAMKTGYSPAANSVARFFVEKTGTAQKFDPQTSVSELMQSTHLTRDDIIDAIYELSEVVGSLHGDNFFPKEELFVRFDEYWKGWSPADDAFKLASDMINDKNFPTRPREIGDLYGWEARRLNPAVAFLEGRRLIRSIRAMGEGDWIAVDVIKTDETRRFVKSRS